MCIMLCALCTVVDSTFTHLILANINMSTEYDKNLTQIQIGDKVSQ